MTDKEFERCFEEFKRYLQRKENDAHNMKNLLIEIGDDVHSLFWMTQNDREVQARLSVIGRKIQNMIVRIEE